MRFVCDEKMMNSLWKAKRRGLWADLHPVPPWEDLGLPARPRCHSRFVPSVALPYNTLCLHGVNGNLIAM